MTVAKPPDDGNLTPDQIAARDAVIQADYCAGIKPLRQIGSEHKLSHTAIGKMAKERGWIRNLKARIQAKADSKVAKAAVSKTDSKTVLATENAVVEANALVSRASVSVEVSSDAGVSATVVSAEVSALSTVETCVGFGGPPISKNWPSKLRKAWARAYAVMTKTLRKPVLADASKQDEARGNAA